MKTFKCLVAEAKSIHDSYGRWGHMGEDGSLISGDEHPTAQTHHWDYDVAQNPVGWAQEHPRKKHDSSWGINTNWQPSDKPKLNIRTYGREGLRRAIRHFHKFPHVPGRTVDWDHDVDGAGRPSQISHFGNSVGVHNRMKSHYEEHYGKLEDQ